MVYNVILLVTLTSIILVVYHHLGYPLLLKALAKRSGKQNTPSDNGDNRTMIRSADSDRALPTITILLPAYNEAQWIAEKIRNIAMLEYPNDKLSVIVACDGCQDDTAKIARNTGQEAACLHLNLSVIEYPVNQGKVATINQTMPRIHSDIVALSDISALISYDALMIAAQRFQAPEIGVLNSHYCFLNPNSEEQQYWEYQSKIQHNEAQVGSVLGAHGALYFIRRHLFTPLESDTINDDFVLPMRIVQQGFRADVVDDIHAVELETSNQDQDFRRRLRIGAGNCQQLLRLGGCLHPKFKGVAFAFASGKALRVVMPFLMLIALLGSVALAPLYSFFLLAAVAQLCLYLLVVVSQFTPLSRCSGLIKTLNYLVVGHTANFIGAIRYSLGLEKGHWQRVSKHSNYEGGEQYDIQ